MRFTNQSNICYESAMVRSHWLNNLPKELLEAEGCLGLGDDATSLKADGADLICLRQRLKTLDSPKNESPNVWGVAALNIWQRVITLFKPLVRVCN